jgi:DNA-binding NarL/FixJ family response regulator
VDDHPVVREGLAEMINRQPGFRVCGEAEDRARALAAIETCKPDLAIVDLALKDSSGIELIKDIRARHPQLRVLVVSMHDEMVNAERVVRAGASGYVTKEEAATRIVSAIQRVLEGGIYVSDRVTSQITAKLAGRPQGAALETLADRELQVFELIGEGLSTQQIAERLHLGAGTVETYRARIKEKLLLKDAHELLQSAIHWNRGQGS